jgi:hypothetical protein
MGKKKKSRVRQKQPFLRASGLPIQTLDWLYHMPEMILILGLLEEMTAQDVGIVFANLQTELRKLSGCRPCQSLTAWVSELAECLESDATVAQKAKAYLGKIFSGANGALLRRFDVPGKTIILNLINLPDADPMEDYKQIMRVVGKSFDGSGGRATRAKLVHLILLDPGLRGFHSINKENLAPLLAAKDDSLPQNAIPGQVRASWGDLVAMKDGVISGWPLGFWLQGSSETPCMKAPEPTIVETVEPDAELFHVVGELDRLWRAVVAEEPRHAIASVASVTLGLMGRVWRMTHHIIDLSKAGNGEMAEIALRCQCDTYLTLLWLIKQNDPALFQRFVEYSSGKDKALLEYVRKMGHKDDPKLKDYKTTMERDLSADIWREGIWEQLAAEERGAWTNASPHAMATDIGREHVYRTVFSRASDIVHGSWRDLKRYHLQRCLNPLHQYHWIPYVGPTHDAGLTPIVGGIMNALEALRAIVRAVCTSESPLIEPIEKLMKLFRSIVSSRSPLEGFRKAATPDGKSMETGAGPSEA